MSYLTLWALWCLLSGMTFAFGCYRIIHCKSVFWSIIICSHIAMAYGDREFNKEGTILQEFFKKIARPQPQTNESEG